MAKPKILIVEDERIVAEDIQRSLRNFDYVVSSIVSSGEEALKEVEEHKPDLVLMDIKLRGDIDGVEAAERIRASFDIPIVYITALADQITVQRAKMTEPFGYIHKPIEEKELLSNIEIAFYRHNMERKLKESEERYRSLFEDSRDAIYITSRDGELIDSNQAFLNLFGFSRKDIKGMKAQERYVHPGDRKKFQAEIEKKGFIRDYEVKLRKKDGTEMDCLITATVRRAQDGSILGYQGIIRDITERKRMTEALQESEEHYKELANSITDVFFAMDKDLRYTFWNKASEKLTGISAKDAIGKSLYDLFPDTSQTRKAEIVYRDVLRTKHPQTFVNEYKLENKDFFFEISAYPSRDGISVFVRDITERRHAEEEKERLQARLIQSEKMAGVGTLASGIAHEFNNLLQIMRMGVEFAQKTQRSKDIQETLDTVLDTSDRAAKIVKDLLAFSKQETAEKELCHISEPIESVLSIAVEQLKKHNIKVVRRYERTPMIEVNKEEMKQVFLNMVTNARDAMLPNSGTLEIGVKQVKEHVEVSFRDTGRGIEEENLSKVFEPFYTTKGAVGGSTTLPGTGLGLSVSYGIVKRHGGTVEVKSQVGQGTTFTVKLPVKRKETKRRIIKEKKKKEVKKTKPLKILVVDDEEEICRMFTKYLSSEGHKVKAVATGRKAINLFENEYFNIVFLDIVMPGISCVEVLDKIKVTSPKTRVVIITGKFMDKDSLTELKQKGASAFLQKPFKIDDIMDAIPGKARTKDGTQ